MITLFLYSLIAFAADIALFQVLYFCVVLPRIGDAGGKVKGDALLNVQQHRYVAKYLELLTTQERSRWYNIYLKNSRVIIVVLLLVCVAFFVLSNLQG
jgi:hypothetical protein